MKKLIITAQPASDGFTHVLANRFGELSIEKGDEVELLDLYKTELYQDFLGKHECDMEVMKSLQEKITWADELVFVFPIWWGDMPAIMKNFWDINFTRGFAFRYENGKSIGLLKGKSARIIATSGAPGFFYTVLLHIQLLWNMNRIAFCGMKQKSFTVFGNIDRKDAKKDAYLNALEKLV